MINKKCKHCAQTLTTRRVPNGVDRDFNTIYTENDMVLYKCFKNGMSKTIETCKGCTVKKGWFR